MNATKDLSKILTKGSAMQRALLFHNHMAEKLLVSEGRWEDKKGFLTESEETQLYNSFKNESEIKLYNRLLHLRDSIGQNLVLLKQLQFEYQESISRLTGYCLLYHAYTEFEEALNGIYYSMETPDQRKKVLNVMEAHTHFLFAKIGPAEDLEKDGIKMRERAGRTFREILGSISRRALYHLGQAKTLVKVIRDSMTENEFDIKAFKDILEVEEKMLQEDSAPLPKFSRKKTEEGILKYADNAEQRQRMEEIFRPNWVFPEYKEAVIDETLYKVMREEKQT